MKVIAIVQARMGSTRLPGKMTKEILGKPIVEYVFDRVRPSKRLTEIWLATTTDTSDDVLAEWAKNHGVKCYRGSMNDVLDRYYQTAKLAEADVVVRITGDCPLADCQVIDCVINEYLTEYPKFDYVCNTQPPTFPDGLDTEVVSFVALEKAWQEARLSSEREHVTPYIWNHPEIFRLHNIVSPHDLSAQRWTLDTAEDLEFIRRIVAECQHRGVYCGLEEIMDIIAAHPEWLAINRMHERNEGY